MGKVTAFEPQQLGFGLDAAFAGITMECAIAGKHTVAGNDDRDRIASAGRADGPGMGLQILGHFPISYCFSIRNFAHGSPNSPLEGGPVGSQRQVEAGQCAIEISVQLILGPFQNRAGLLIGSPAPIEGDDHAVEFADGNIADRAMKRNLWHLSLSVTGPKVYEN